MKREPSPTVGRFVRKMGPMEVSVQCEVFNFWHVPKSVLISTVKRERKKRKKEKETPAREERYV